MFGKEALNRIIRDSAHGSAEDLIQAITEALTEFRQDRVQMDDVTVVVIKVLDPEDEGSG